MHHEVLNLIAEKPCIQSQFNVVRIEVCASLHYLSGFVSIHPKLPRFLLYSCVHFYLNPTIALILHTISITAYIHVFISRTPYNVYTYLTQTILKYEHISCGEVPMDKLLYLKADHTKGNLSSIAEQETRQLRTSAHTFSVYIHGDKNIQ